MCQQVKQCNVCYEMKPVSDFYFRSDTAKYKSKCKRCCIDGKNLDRSKTTKKCKHCGEEKPFSEYQKAGGGKWLQPYCKPCDSIRKKKWESLNIEPIKVKRRAYYMEVAKHRYVPHPKKLKTKEEKRQRDKKYRMLPEVKLKKAAADKRYRERNSDKVQARKKEYYKKNGLQQAKAWQKKMMTNVEFRTKKRLRGRVYVALKRGIKSESTMELLGCSIEHFKKYFESLFTEGMSWDTYLSGGIHIDHIIPCKSFDLTDPEQQKKCFHYTNLQPLWELDNYKKGASLNYNKKAA